MRGKVLAIVLAMALWPLCSKALTRDAFLVRTTQDLVKLCTVSDRLARTSNIDALARRGRLDRNGFCASIRPRRSRSDMLSSCSDPCSPHQERPVYETD